MFTIIELPQIFLLLRHFYIEDNYRQRRGRCQHRYCASRQRVPFTRIADVNARTRRTPANTILARPRWVARCYSPLAYSLPPTICSSRSITRRLRDGSTCRFLAQMPGIGFFLIRRHRDHATGRAGPKSPGRFYRFDGSLDAPASAIGARLSSSVDSAFDRKYC